MTRVAGPELTRVSGESASDGRGTCSSDARTKGEMATGKFGDGGRVLAPAYATAPSSRMASKTARTSGGGAMHMVRYASTMGTQNPEPHLEPSTYLISLSCEGFSNPLRRLGEGRLIEYELGLGGSPALLIATYGIDRVDESLIAVDKLDK